MIFFSDPGARRPSRQRKAHRMYERAPKRRAARPLVAREPLRERWPGGRLALPVQLAREVAEQPLALGDDVVLVDRFEVLLPGAEEGARAEVSEAFDGHAHHLAHAVLDEPRPTMGLLDDVCLIGSLEELVDL